MPSGVVLCLAFGVSTWKMGCLEMRHDVLSHAANQVSLKANFLENNQIELKLDCQYILQRKLGKKKMVDHHRVLGLSKNATKDEIKEAFRKLALKFHPDKHAQSSKSARDDAALKFKQVSEAYEVLLDDRKRAAYNLRYSSRNDNSYSNGSSAHSYNNYSHYGGSYYKPRYRAPSNRDGWVSKLEIALQFLTTRAFLLNLAFAGILLGGSLVFDMSREALWKKNNPGKSFEEALESIEKNRVRKDKQ